MSSSQLPDLLFVSDDALLARSVQVAAHKTFNVVIVHDVARARAHLLATPHTRAMIVDGALAAARDVQECVKLRLLAPLAQVLFVAPRFHAALVNDTQAARVQLVVRPLPAQAIKLFVERASRAGVVPRRALAVRIAEFARDNQLTPEHLAFIPHALDLETLEQVCQRLGIDRTQAARGLRKLVKKCRLRTSHRLARYLLRDAYLSSSEFTVDFIEPASASCF